MFNLGSYRLFRKLIKILVLFSPRRFAISGQMYTVSKIDLKSRNDKITIMNKESSKRQRFLENGVPRGQIDCRWVPPSWGRPRWRCSCRLERPTHCDEKHTNTQKSEPNIRQSNRFGYSSAKKLHKKKRLLFGRDVCLAEIEIKFLTSLCGAATDRGGEQ